MRACVESGMIIEFPVSEIMRPAAIGAGRMSIFVGRCREAIGRLMNASGLPGAIRPVTISDTATGREIEVAVSDLSVRLTVDGRDYYFDRLTGQYDGSGSGI